MVAAGALLVFRRGLPTKFTAPHDQGLLEHASLFEILDQACNGLVRATGMEVVVLLDVGVGVPVVVVVGPAGVELNETHPPLDQATRQETATPELLGARVVEAIKTPGRRTLAGQIHRLRRMPLHVEGQFVAGDAGSKVGVLGVEGSVVGVELMERIQHATLGTATHARRTLKVENRISRRPKDGALVGRRHVATGPVLGPRNGASNGIEHHREARQVLTGCAQTVIDP